MGEFARPSGPALNRLFAAFRASGRFVWPVVYALQVFLLACVLRLAPRKLALGILTACVLLQLADLTKAYAYYRDRWSAEWQNPLVSAFWQQVPQQYKRVAFVLPLDDIKNYVPVAFLASRNGMKVNGGYLARVDGNRLQEVADELVRTVRSGDYRPDTLYVFFNNEYWNEARAHFKGAGAVGVVDSYRVIAPEWRGCTTTCGMHDGVTRLEMEPLPDDAPYLESGWSKREPDGRWTDGTTARLALPALRAPFTALQVRLNFAAFVNARHPAQHVTVCANGHPLAQWTQESGDPQSRSFVIHAADLLGGQQPVTIDFDLPDAISPKALELNDDERRLAIKVRFVEIEPN